MSIGDWSGLAMIVISYGGLGYLIWRFGFRRLVWMVNDGLNGILHRILEGPQRKPTRDEEIERLERDLGIGERQG